MDLSSLAAQTATIEVPDGELTVRGLGLSDISRLVQRHRSDLEGAFNQVADAAQGAEEDGDQMISRLLGQAPQLAAEIIALALDEPDQVEQAGKLPISLQLAILEKCGDLTFVGEGGMGKTMEIVIKMISGATQAADLLSLQQSDSTPG
jgi:hypothetical protein